MKILDRYSMFEVLAVCLTFKFHDDDYKSVVLLASESLTFSFAILLYVTIL